MGMKPGSSSWPGPPRERADHITNALVVFGILVSCVFVAGSALLNFRMGFTSADNDTDGKIYGSLAAAGDGLKALSPFVMAYGWKHRDWLAAFAATTVFVIFTAYSFTSALGFSSQHRAAKEGAVTSAIEQHADARRQLARDNERLDQLGPQRSSAEMRQAISNKLLAPVGSGRWTVDQVSAGCSVNKAATREACGHIADLKLEAAQAEEAERLEVEIRTLTQKSKVTPATSTANPQTAALTFLGRLLHLMPKEDKENEGGKEAGFGLSLLMAIFIELGSGLGSYIATTPWRSRPVADTVPAPSPALPPLANVPPLEAFAGECLERRNGHQLHLAVAFEAYKEWCEKRNRPMQGKSRFERGLLKLAKEVALEVDSNRAGWMIRDMALRGKRLRRGHG